LGSMGNGSNRTRLWPIFRKANYNTPKMCWKASRTNRPCCLSAEWNKLAWSPDSKIVALYLSQKKTGKEYATIHQFPTSICIIRKPAKPSTSQKACRVTTPTRNFLPTEKYIAWQSMEREGYESDKKPPFSLWICNRKKKTYVTEKFRLQYRCLHLECRQQNLVSLSPV